ncbi:MAG: Rpn family recombination-promoting nuclease/putative transposase [Clostridia bacterium]|nr:Rpn family recombination-promoting nuclease/putative transposase [Clostridia bacterium]
MTKNLEFCIIELPKYERYINKNKELSKWVKFIRNPEEISMEDMNNNEALRKAKEELNRISDDEREEELAFQRLIYKMDIEATEALGYDKGLKVGLEEGRQEGEKNKAIKIAKNLLKQNISIEIIIECTGLTKEEIEKLKL